MNKSEKIKKYLLGRFGIAAKMIFVFSLIILLVGFAINYFLIKFLELYLKEVLFDQETLTTVINVYSLLSAAGLIVFVLLSAIFLYYMFGLVVRNLLLVKKAMAEIAKGNMNYDIEIDDSGEMGELASIFKSMVKKIKEYKEKLNFYSGQLEERVSQKTQELQNVLEGVEKDKINLQEQRSAILNILEDMQESQDELEISKNKLEQRQFELESLKSLGDKLTSVIDVDEAIILVEEYLKKISQSCVITIMVSNSIEAGDLYFKSLLNSSVGENYIKFIKKDIILYIKNKINNFDNSYINLLDKIMPSLKGEKMDNSNKTVPTQTVIAPLVAGGKTFGVIHLSYCEDKTNFAKMENDLIFALASTLSICIARLRMVDKYQHSKTESLIKSLNDGVIMFSNEKSIVLTNPKATEYTGLSYSVNTLFDFIKLFEDFDIEKKINLALRNGLVSHIKEVKLLNKYYEIIVSPVKDNEGEIVGGSVIMHDITYIKEIDKMKTEFVSVASHQLRTPLTAIKLFTEMLIRQDVGKLNKEQKEYLDNVFNSTERMVRLVNDLLNVTRIESGRLRVSPLDTDISEFINDVITEAKPTAKMENVVIKFDKIQMPKVPLDKNLFRQVIQNMLSNAIRYSCPNNGVVKIKVQNKKNDFIISVSDNGIGIPEKMQKRIFEKFYRADNAIKSVTEGTGLGLYVSKMIVENSGGSIWFESKENKGATFYVKMPLSGMRAIEGDRGLAIS